MAVLGVGGRLELRREAASPCVITPEDINLGSSTFDLGCEGYWPGDRVVISGPEGLPIFIDGKPQLWDGVATYDQGTLFVAENRDHIKPDPNNDFYKQSGHPNNSYYRGNSSFENDNALFYYQGEKAGDQQTEQLEGYLCVDSLGRARLYPTRCEGMACCGESLYTFTNDIQVGDKIDFDFIVINHYGSGEYQNAITQCFGEIGEYIFNDIAENDNLATYDPNRRVDSICNDPPLYLKPAAGSDEFNNADVQPRGSVNQGPHPLWTVLCGIREYSLNLDAPSVDTTGVGEKFGNGVKSLVNGGGNFEFFIDRKCFEDGKDNGIYIMRLLLMTQEGAKAHAKFYLMDRGNGDDETCQANCGGDLPGALWYESDIFITNNAINLRPKELVAGSAQFVTTGTIKLQEGKT